MKDFNYFKEKYASNLKVIHSDNPNFQGSFDPYKLEIEITNYSNNKIYILLHEVGHSKDKLTYNNAYLNYYSKGLQYFKLFLIIFYLCFIVKIIIKHNFTTYLNYFDLFIYPYLLSSFIILFGYFRAELIADLYAIKILFKENQKFSFNNITSLKLIVVLFYYFLLLKL